MNTEINKDVKQVSSTAVSYDNFIKARETQNQIEELVNDERSSDEETRV